MANSHCFDFGISENTVLIYQRQVYEIFIAQFSGFYKKKENGFAEKESCLNIFSVHSRYLGRTKCVTRTCEKGLGWLPGGNTRQKVAPERKIQY